MYPTEALKTDSVPPRVLCAALRDLAGHRIGRFGLYLRGAQIIHRWEWLGRPWPDVAFRMEPSAFELQPCPTLSRAYGMPSHATAFCPLNLERIEAGTRRVYDIERVDGPVRHIASLAICDRRLHWLEAGLGGILELCPAWLVFEPRRADDNPPRYARQWVQPELQQSRPDTTPAVIEQQPLPPLSATLAWPFSGAADWPV